MKNKFNTLIFLKLPRFKGPLGEYIVILKKTTPDQLKREIRRKAFHLLVLILPVAQYLLSDDPQTRTILITGGAAFAGILLVFEAMRLRNPSFFANRFAREEERDRIAAYVPNYFSAYFIFLCFGFKIAAISIFISALGDAAAALCGMRFGVHRMPFTKKKSLEGAGAGFSITLLVSLIYTKLWLTLALASIMFLTDFIEEPKTTFLSDNMINPFFFAVLLHLAPHGLR